MLYKKLTSLLQDESRGSSKDRKKKEKHPDSENNDPQPELQCTRGLHLKFTQNMLRLVMLNEAKTTAKTLKLISLLP